MRIQVASDLHLEHLDQRFPGTRLVEPAAGADLLVLAGDIHNGVKAVEAFADWPVPVVYVAGNHEFYEQDWEPTRRAIRAACAGTRVVFLDNDAVEIGGLRILGCTLWTDFKLHGTEQTQAMATAERVLMDYRIIRTVSGPLRARQTLVEHERSRAWLESELAKPFTGTTVVVTHHGPHPMSVHPRFVGNPVNPGYISDLTPLLGEVDLWVHGHTHDSFDYRIGRCRVVANPAGYVLNRATAGADVDFTLENAKFDRGLLLEVGA